MSFLENNFFLLCYHLRDFLLCQIASKKTGLVLLNPILLTHRPINQFLKMTNISYETYNKEDI